MRPLAVLVLLAVPALAADWPQLLGPGRDGRTAEKDLLDTFGNKGPEVLWERKLGDGYAGPVVAGGKVIVFHRVGGEDVVECLSADKGQETWKYTYKTSYEDNLGKGDGPRSTPVVHGGKVYTLGAGGQLHCVDLKSGKKAWSKELLADYTVKPSYFGVGTTPIVEGGLLVVNVGGGGGAGIVAFDAKTGKQKWKATDHEASYSSPIAATIDGVRMLIFFTREGVVALSPQDGKEVFSKRWRAKFDASVNAAMPVLADKEHVLVTASYNTGAMLLKVNKGGAKEVWSSDRVLSAHFSTPVVAGKYLYGFDGRQEGGASLRCVDWKAGKVMWTEGGFGCGAIIAAGEKLFVFSEDGELALVAASGDRYAEKARAKVLDGPVRAHPALADGRLYARDGKKLVCWKVKK